MIAEFPDAFQLIFSNSDKRLTKLLKQKIKTIRRVFRPERYDHKERHNESMFMNKFKSSICRKFNDLQRESLNDGFTEKDTVFYEHSKHVSVIFEDTDSDISDEDGFQN